MKWYNRYLAVFEKPFLAVSEEIVLRVTALLLEKQSNNPLVSVVVIAHNESTRILSCLWSIVENQCHFPIEILVVNNHSTDETEAVLSTLGVTYFNETKKGPGHARQCGLDHAKGLFHVCIDADTIYPPHYIDTHVKALMKPGVVGVFSLWSFIPNQNHTRYSLRIYEFLRDIYLRMQAIKRPELCVRGMALSFKTDVAKTIGFRRDIVRGEDGSLALELKKQGELMFLTRVSARALTSCGTLNAEGPLYQSVRIRCRKAFKSAGGLFLKKERYNDQESNLIKNNVKLKSRL